MADKLNFYTVDLGYVDLLKVAELKKRGFILISFTNCSIIQILSNF